MKRKRHDERQLALDLAAAKSVEHRVSKAANDVEFKGISVGYRKISRARGTTNLAELTAEIRAQDRLRQLEPTSLPKKLRGWSPRPRPQTAIIARAAQARCDRRVNQGEVIEKFLGQRAGRLRRLADKLRRSK